MEERLKNLRNALNMNQKDFAQSLGLGQSTWAMIEVGKRELNDRHIKLICSIHNVNENWLRTGNGEMFTQLSQDDETAHIVQDMLGNNTGSFYNIILEIAKSYKKLSPTSQKALNELADNLLAGLVNKEEKDESEMTFDELIAECPKTPEELERLYPPVNINPKVVSKPKVI